MASAPVPDLVIKQHDTWAPLTATLTDAGVAIDLTTASQVLLLMKGTTVLVEGTCTVAADPTTGVVTYSWAVGDTAIADTYNVEFQITWSTGKIETVPNSGYKTVQVYADLGP